jgi:outer membrane receptor protein involved in Fe transport
MFKNLLMTLAVVLATCTMTMAQSQGRLKGKITDETGETVPFANVIVEKGGAQVAGASSDFDGNYDINPIPPGTYDLKASCIGYNAFVVKNIVIPANKITFYNIKMASGAIKIDEVVVIDYEIPLISADNTQSGATITSEEIAKLPVRSAEGVAASVGGVFSSDGEVGSIRGSREGAVYYIDGVKVIGNGSVPQGAIDQVDVILGGTPAMYGDAMGGIINMTTKGPSRQWGGSLEAEYSVDGYGHGRLGGSLQGPLVKVHKEGEEEKALLGFFLAFDLNRNEYGSTSAVGYYRANEDWMNTIKTRPLTLSGLGTSTYQTAAFTRKDDNLYHTRFLNNTANQSINVTGKIDVSTGKNSNLTIGGSLYRGGGHYDGGSGQHFFNTEKNYLSKSGTYRGYVRFSQRFPSDPNSTSLISNVYYSIQADYTHTHSESGDPDLWDNIFGYGHIGKFTTTREPNFRFSAAAIDSVLMPDGQYKSISNAYVLDNYFDTYVDFEEGKFNPLLATYVKNYYDLYEPYGAVGFFNNISNIVLNNGLVNGMSPAAVYQMYAVPGTVQTGYSKSASDQISVNVNGSMTLGRGDNSHEIKLGFQYEQRNNAAMQYNVTSYNRNPWTLMRQMVNAHIAELDVDHPYAISYDGFVDTIMFNRMYDASTQFTIDARLRQAMGLPVDGTEWILTDTYDFDNNTINYYDVNGNLKTAKVEGGLDLSMFGADELTRDAQYSVYYYGYTYDGNRKYSWTERPSLTDFFITKDSDNLLTRPIGAQQPIYMAGYIQDKFAFKDLIFNIGVRVDRFDANQSVLKDPYVLYDFYTVGDLKSLNLHLDDNSAYVIPDNIGDDYVPYVNKLSEKTSIVGYRKGNTWYNEVGAEINDPTAIGMGAGSAPWLKDANQQTVDEKSFKDYDPAWSVMPRISFSFPISDEALFFAHYDVLTQRPTSAFYCSPLYYYRFNESSSTLANPNLKPQQTIDYELGFTQKVTNTSSLTITAYYREIRNQIQMYRFNGAYPKAYNSYSNLDFGTVKGLTASYDLRRTKNARIRADYTLQYAENTGSSTSTAAALIAAGVPNLRSTFPTTEDRRHGFNLTLDYRYSDGKNYDGPVIHRKDGSAIQVLSNTGVSLVVMGGSGTPYTASRTVSSPISGGNNLLQGTYNGSRMPASFRFDLRVDKDFNFMMGGKKEGSKGRAAFMNVYLQVLNLLNSQNITYVYPATGNANDDGYLSAPEWQREINSMVDPQSFIQMYSLIVNSGYNYSMPRHIRLGLSFNF